MPTHLVFLLLIFPSFTWGFCLVLFSFSRWTSFYSSELRAVNFYAEMKVISPRLPFQQVWIYKQYLVNMQFPAVPLMWWVISSSCLFLFPSIWNGSKAWNSHDVSWNRSHMSKIEKQHVRKSLGSRWNPI